jgi:lipopolysaccharide export system protein LptC
MFSPTVEHATAARPETAARRREALRTWRRHSQRIALLRKALPAAIVALLALLFGWVAVQAVLTRIGDARDSIASIHMSNARFYGRDGDGRGYVLAAGEASRDNVDYQRIQLKNATLTLAAESPGQTQVSAAHGVYRENDRILRLDGRVTFRDSAGNVFTTDQALVDTINGTIVGAGKIRGTGPSGVVSAGSFEIFNRGQDAVFRGNVHSRLKQG